MGVVLGHVIRSSQHTAAMKFILIAVAVIVGATAAWRFRSEISNWVQDKSGTAKPFVFDNGSNKSQESVAATNGAPRQSATQPGAMKKCVRGEETTYTNFACPPGFNEKGVASDRLTVLTHQAVPAVSPQAASSAPKNGLKDALGMNQDDRLKDRMMDRAIESATR
jgi:hypothetical protein